MLPFQKLGNYQVTEELGEGGFAQVFLACHETLGTLVALKVLKAPEYLEAFIREGCLYSTLESPYIVKILDIFPQNDPPYLVMEYAEGGSLGHYLKQNAPLPLEEALAILEQMGKALQCAHRHGILHGDLKPENILRGKEGLWKLSDFGLALPTAPSPVEYSGSLSGSLSKEKGIAGTLSYMAPEALQGKASQRSDIYSLGLLLFEMLHARLPQGNEHLTKLRKGNEALEALFLKCYTHVEGRFETIDDFLDALAPLRENLNRLRYASLLARFNSSLLDLCCVYLLCCLFPPFFAMILRKKYYLAVFFFVYTSVFEALWGRTPGKFLFSLRLQNLNGNRVDSGTVFLRTVLSIPALLALFIGVFPALFRKNRQTLYDLACNTVVIQE